MIAHALAALIAAAPPPGPGFVDAGAAAGIDSVVFAGGAVKDHLLESTGSGLAWVDYDGDGRPDLYVVNGWALDEDPSGVRARGANALYRNLGDGTFADVTARSGTGDDGWGCGVCAGDYDDDGHVDLYVTNFGPNVLYRNRGDGTFEDATARAGVGDAGWGGGAAFFDADADGDLDLYVANYVACTLEEVLAARRTTRWRNTARVMAGPFGLAGGRDRFYRNEGDGTFTDATDEAGLTDTAERYGLAVVASDLDADGDVDLYVANDSNPNFLYRNEGDGTFTDVGGWCGAGLDAGGAAQAGMGADAGDFDGDGRLDLIVTNFARDRCTLYRNTGDLFFDDVTTQHEIGQVTYHFLSWGCAFFDFDLDGDEDLAVVNGHIYPQVEEHAELDERYAQRPLLFENAGGRYRDASRAAGPAFRQPAAARGLALADYDGDGDLDLAVSVMDGPPRLLRNDFEPSGHWVRLRLLNRHGSAAIGARAVVSAGGVRGLRELRSGSAYQSQNALDLHFGLGSAATVGAIEITWPDGARSELRGVAADRVITVEHPAP
jgi:hypothetical protein